MSWSRPSRALLGWKSGIAVPDEVLLRRFGHVRAVGGAAYFVAVAVLYGIFGRQVWPLALGVPVLAVVTLAYFTKSSRHPRTAVAASLVADTVVLGGAIMFLGGSGSGLVLLYAIVVVSAAILLGPVPGAAFTVLCVGMAVAQLTLEELGVEPTLLYRPDAADRVPILLASVGGVAAVGYLSATYANRLHELVAMAGAEAKATRERGERRQEFVRSAAADVQAPLSEVERVAELLEDSAGVDERRRQELAGRLRVAVTRLEDEIGVLADVGVMDSLRDARPVPVSLPKVVEECRAALQSRLASHDVELDLAPVKVVGERRAIRRVVFSLMENVAEHTPPGTHARVTAAPTAGHGVLLVSDDGPGMPPEVVDRVFDPPAPGTSTRVGLPLVRELCEAMGARIRCDSASGKGTRVAVLFRMAPPSAPSVDDEAGAVEPFTGVDGDRRQATAKGEVR